MSEGHISSLQDLLLMREIKNRANFGYSAIKAMADGVALGIEEQRQKIKQKKDREDLFNDLNKLSGNTNQNKITTSINEKGQASYKIEPMKQEDDYKEKRIMLQAEQEERRQMNDFGATFTPTNPDDERRKKLAGIDIDQLMAEGKARRNEDGSVYMYDRTTRNRIESQKTIPDEVQKSISEFKDSRDILVDSVNEYRAMGLNEIKTDWHLVKQIINPVGPLSAEAKSNLLRQMNNPRLAALSDKLERVFQKYRIKVTGVQASDKELARLRPLIANLAQNPEAFLLNAEGLLKEMDQAVTNRIGVAKASGKDEKTLKDIEDFYFSKTKKKVEVNDADRLQNGKTSKGTSWEIISE